MLKSNLKDLTIVIPTKNRKEWLSRSLRYYINEYFDGSIIIADSSTKYNPDKFLKKIKDFYKFKNSKLVNKIQIINCPRQNAEGAINKALNYVTTKYTVVHNDDDILLFQNISKGISFLKKNSDYVGFTGKSFQILTKNNKPFCNDIILKNYKLINSTKNSPISRCFNFLSSPENAIIVVMHTVLAKKAFRAVCSLNYYHQTYFFGEIIHALTVCAEGKIKLLNFSYCVRHKHGDSIYNKLNVLNFFIKNDIYKSNSLIEKLFKKIYLDKYKKKKLFLDKILKAHYENILKPSQNKKTKYILKNIIFKLKDNLNYSFIDNLIWTLRKRKYKIDSDKNLNNYLNYLREKDE